VLRDGAARDVHSLGDLADRAHAAAKPLEDLPASRISECVQNLVCVSHD
jgi:hypothetical protein